MSKDYTTKETVTEYKTGWFNAGYDLVQQPDETTKKYYWADLSPAATAVAIKDNGNLLFVNQYRPTIKQNCTELPTGIVEDGETFEQAAARELQEETGYYPHETELLEAYHVATGILRHKRGIVLATNLEEREQKLDENEFLETHELSPEEAIKNARQSPVTDATLTALLLAKEDGHI